MARDDVASQRDDARKRREKRRELRTAIDAARVNQEELQKPECDDLERAVDAADAMNEGVDKPGPYTPLTRPTNREVGIAGGDGS